MLSLYKSSDAIPCSDGIDGRELIIIGEVLRELDDDSGLESIGNGIRR